MSPRHTGAECMLEMQKSTVHNKLCVKNSIVLLIILSKVILLNMDKEYAIFLNVHFPSSDDNKCRVVSPIFN